MISHHLGRPRESLDGDWRYRIEREGGPGESLGYPDPAHDASAWHVLQPIRVSLGLASSTGTADSTEPTALPSSPTKPGATIITSSGAASTPTSVTANSKSPSVPATASTNCLASSCSWFSR